MLSERL